jgi:large subunit ribosomal protein L5
MNSLEEKYKKEVVPDLKKRLHCKSLLEVPTLEKIIVNVGLGEAIQNPQALEKVSEDLALITGQKPLITKARKAISNFNLRAGADIGLKVSLRRERMWNFFQKLISVVLPRVRDFRGVSPRSFDGRGNYSLGIREHTVFPEIDPNKVDKLRSLQITIVTTAENDKEGLVLLEELGMPFAKGGEAEELIKMKEMMRKEKKELSKMKAKRLAEGRKIEERRKEE